jgi:prevent-host-death family protein
MSITPTQLRADLYNILDKVIETHQPVEITRKGHILKLVVEEKSNKLDTLKPHPGTLQGDPESIVSMDWSSYWQGDKEL